MGRPLRTDVADGRHHVMNRGAGRRAVFSTAADGHRFLGLVAEGVELSGVRILAYCLMRTHYHLLVHCPDAGLSEFMHRLGSMYTRFRNQRTDSDGPIFRGRFHALPITSVDYLDCAGRYIHRNPLDVTPPVRLDRYRWSSYQYYAGGRRAPDWLEVSELAGMHDGPVGYREFVEGMPRRAAAVDWAVATALMEIGGGDDVMGPHVSRTVMLAMLAGADGHLAQRLDGLLEFPNAKARASAMSRMRTRLRQQPELAAVAEAALRLAA